MDCPICFSKTATSDSRTSSDHTKRRRKCLSCGYRFTTIEIDMDSYRKQEQTILRMREFMKGLEVNDQD